MNIIVDNETDFKINENLIKKVIEAALVAEKVNTNAQISVFIVAKDEIRLLNKEHRGIDDVTDVLSFPMINFAFGEIIPLDGEYMLGDIVLSIEIAQEQALEYGHTQEREIGFLVLHGTLHLLGYTHDNEDDEKIMVDRQKELLDAVGLKR